MNIAASLSNQLLSTAIQKEATDIHFYPTKTDTYIYFRINGERILHSTFSNKQYHTLLTYYKFTSGMDIGERQKPQESSIAQIINKTQYFLRLSILPTHQAESLAIRILPQQELKQLNELFLFPKQLEHVKNWIQHKAGIILITGPTGSGKTTTLYALLQSILQETSYQTITLEDPIEKNMTNILQVQVNEKAGMTYQTGLKAALRHDPDIIMVGEIRDKATAKFAIEASLTGHLVLSTLHAKDAFGTIQRLKEMGFGQNELKHALIAVAAIELLPIQYKKFNRRAAILELLDNTLLEDVIHGITPNKNTPFQSFQHLRKKAYAYGFLPKI